MKLNKTFIENYRDFRNIFESEEEATAVTSNLEKEIQNDIAPDESAHIKLQYWPHYDEEGLAGFEVTSVKFAHDKAYINLKFICTAK